ncbi:MAG: glycosyl transferase family 90 [Parachlamydiales bacterium]|jgi:hypothetical protein
MSILLNLKGFYHKIAKSNFNFKVEREKLNDAIRSIPEWQKSQVEEELNFSKHIFSEDDSLALINKTIINLRNANLLNEASLVKISIKDNRVSYESFLVDKFHPRFIRFRNFMKKILDFIKLSDTTFLYSISDTLDDPKILNLLEAPVFCISKKNGNNKIILFPHIEWMSKNDGFIEAICKADLQCPWNEKINKVFWRGVDTGFENFEENERFKVVVLSDKYPELIDAKFSGICQNQDLNKYSQLITNIQISPIDQIKYKYLLAIDGNAFPGSFFWQLFSNCVIIKNKSPYLEWYYSGLKKDEHFIEYENEKDLIEKINYCKIDDQRSLEISKKASAFSRQFLSNENIISYIHYLIDRYSVLFN